MRYLILTLLLSFSFSECTDLNALQCGTNTDCEWVEDIETENCYDILDCNPSCNWQDCEAIEGCNWHFGTAYYDPSYCYGEHITDNSYCQENPNPPTCSEMSQIQCNSNSECEWIENTYTGNCSNLNGFTACEAAGCDWECGFSHGSCYWCCWYECGGGSYEIDNSYCQENPDFIQGDLNGDLILNILDVIIIVDIILNQESSDLADMNGDGGINILDVIELVDIIINR